MNITGPVSAIIVALIVAIAALFASGSFESSNNTYATVHFDEGYQRLGFIRSERVFSKAKISMEDREIESGTIDDVLAWIKETSGKSNKSADGITWKEGVTVTASAGIRWEGSESNFDLTTDSWTLESTSVSPLKPLDVISQLQATLYRAKHERGVNSKNALQYGPAPAEMSFVSLINSAINKAL